MGKLANKQLMQDILSNSPLSSPFLSFFPLLSPFHPSLFPSPTFLLLSSLFSTAMASGLPADQLAVPGVDFLPTTGSVAMGDGETSTSINITILHVSVCVCVCVYVCVCVCVSAVA